MLDINAYISNNFQDNISYLETQQSELFSKLSALDSAITNGHYQEKYELVYENDGFDVLEKGTNTYLYAKESLAHTLISENSVNLDNNKSVFEGFIRREFTQEELDKLQKEEPLSDFLKELAPIINYTNKNSSHITEQKEIQKFIFFGVGLGLHIESIHKKLASKIYFIIEDDLELFRLSLFTLNYKKIALESQLVFSVFENKDEFMNSSAIFLDTNFFYNHYLKHFSLLSHNEEKFNQFQLAITSQPHIRFNFANLAKSYLAPLNYLFEDYNFLQKSFSFDNDFFKERSFLLLAMGPSLQKNIQWLKKNHTNFITLAVSSSLAFLEEHNIVPDIILHTDPFEWGVQSFEKLKDISFIKESLCFFSAVTPPNIISLIPKERLFLFEIGTLYKNNSLKPSSPCVGSLAYQLLIILKANNIYLLGLDLAVDSQTGKTHSGSHQYNKTLDLKEKAFEQESISYKESLIELPGNHNETVFSTPDFYASIYTIEHFSNRLKTDEQTITNLSDGAKFSQTLSKHSHNIQINEKHSKSQLKEMLKQEALENSESKLSKQELKKFKTKLKHAQVLKQKLYKRVPLESSKMSDYLQDLHQVLCSENDIKNFELSKILDTYLKYISSYLYDFFNYKALEDAQEHLNNLDALLIKQLDEIVSFYIKTLEEKSKKGDK